MYYLFNFIPDGWLSDGLEKVAGAARQILNTLCYTLDTVIYKLIINLYNLFELLCTSRIVSIEEFSDLSKRIGFILGIIMLFRVIFSFIQMLIDPDIISDKEKGAVSIVKKCIIVIIMLGMSSFAFNFLHSVQTNVIKNHIISRLLLPKTVDTDNFGAVLSEQVLLNFYVLNENLEGEEIYDHCENYITGLKNQIITNSNFELGYNCLNETAIMSINTAAGSYEDQEVFAIEFNNILSVVVGGAIVWLIFRYCISVGVRVIQLTILEIISPMPIIAYLAPGKNNMFSEWKKMYFSTYIDAFIRIAIINFIVYICAVILDNWENGVGTFWESVGSPSDLYTKGFIGIVMILALLTFAKKAPELLKKLIPESASKIGFGVGLKDVVGLQRGMGSIFGAVGGALGEVAAGNPIGLITGLFHGGAKGFSSKNLLDATKGGFASGKNAGFNTRQRIASGGSRIVLPGAKALAANYDREKEELETENAAYKAYDGYIEAAEKRAESQILKGEFATNMHAQEALKNKNMAEIYRQQSSNIKRSDYATDAAYQSDLERYAKQASDAESTYLKEMKAAKQDFITSVLNGSKSDSVTLQNLQQAGGVLDANKKYEGFRGQTSSSLFSEGTYEAFDRVNVKAKTRQAQNNNKIAQNQTAGKRARANQKFSGTGK